VTGSEETQTPLQLLQDPVCRFPIFAPRGWVYQNMATVMRLHQNGLGAVDVANGLVVPHKADEAHRRVDAEFKTTTPFNLLAATILPNYMHASETVAHNQTLANEARIACALERHRLARGEYPEALEVLVPQFIDRIPRDIIGGQPLKYHRDADSFTLYSIGWNERDDGGISAMKTYWLGDLTKADWVWPNREKTD
jgi:hypothetical protein